MMTQRALASRGEGAKGVKEERRSQSLSLPPFTPSPFTRAHNRHRHTFLLKFSRRHHETDNQ